MNILKTIFYPFKELNDKEAEEMQKIADIPNIPQEYKSRFLKYAQEAKDCSPRECLSAESIFGRSMIFDLMCAEMKYGNNYEKLVEEDLKMSEKWKNQLQDMKFCNI